LNDANRHVSETSHSSREIAKDIVIVDRATAEMANYSVQVRSSADELSVVAESLQATVSRFHA
jgi:methyl-accepting chemotaxis protein